ncbi:MAG: long-chain fatty acid--CoA ligase [Syntrophobacteraceae bacterium]
MDRVWLESYDPRVPQTLTYPEETLPILLERTAWKIPLHTAVEFFGATLTYGALQRQILSFAAALSRLGVKNGVRVGIMLPNCPQAIIAYYATLWLGGIAVLTNPMYVEREMEHQWADSRVEYLVVLDHLYPNVEKVLTKTSIRKVVVTGIKDYLPFHLKILYPLKARAQNLFTSVSYNNNVLSFSKLIAGSPPNPPPCRLSLDDPALLQYTGGTTGVAKGVVLSHRNILSNVVQASAWFPILASGNERFIGILPFFHVFGMTIAVNLPLYNGNTVILVPRFQVNEFLNILEKCKPTIFPGVPTIFTALVNHPDIASYDLSSIKLCVTGSASMPVEVFQKFEKLTGCIIAEGFGMTEASPVTHCNPIAGARKPGSIGIPLPDTESKIVDLDTGTTELPVGREGEMLVRGPQVMQGYWKLPEETRETLRDGWLYTGDIAKTDEAGYFYIVDRKKDVIIAGGFNIYPKEIDEVLCQHAKVDDAVTVGIPDSYRGETVKVFVLPKPGENLTEAELVQFCKERLAAYKVPRIFEFRETLPKTTLGKTLRKDLRNESFVEQNGKES